jgi:hypothetical protein
MELKIKIRIIKYTNMKTYKYLLLFSAFLLFFAACEEERFEITSGDSVPPGQPVFNGFKPLHGGARIFFTAPADEDLLSIDAVVSNGDKSYTFSVSYFTDSVDVLGLAKAENYTVKLYAVDRAGNRSSAVDASVQPLESAYAKVAKTVYVKPGFNAFYVDWVNELGEAVNVFVDYTFTQNGVSRQLLSVFVSADSTNRVFVNDLDLEETSPVNVKVRVSDLYENFSETHDFGNMFVLKDVEIPKFDAQKNPLWSMPDENEYPPFGGGVPQVDGIYFDGITAKVIDGLIDRDGNLNYMFVNADGEYADPDPCPWSVLIDLGDYYELSRIVSHQRWSSSGSAIERGNYYQDVNVGSFNMYRWDEEKLEWEFLSYNKIAVPQGTLSDIQWMQLGRAGDMAYMYPDEPGYTKPTRWFRYEALSNFADNYTNPAARLLSEITLYAKKK